MGFYPSSYSGGGGSRQDAGRPSTSMLMSCRLPRDPTNSARPSGISSGHSGATRTVPRITRSGGRTEAAGALGTAIKCSQQKSVYMIHSPDLCSSELDRSVVHLVGVRDAWCGAANTGGTPREPSRIFELSREYSPLGCALRMRRDFPLITSSGRHFFRSTWFSL